MSEKEYENIIKETIVLTDLKNLNKKYLYQYYNIKNMKQEKEKNEPNKSKEEIKAEIYEEIKKNINKLKEGNYEKYYKIDEQKSKELELTFKQIKLKITFNSRPKLLRDGLFCTFYKGNFTIYNNKIFNKSYEIKFDEKDKIKSVIQLDNKDIVFLIKNQLIIYRLQNEKYILLQKIEENEEYYDLQYSHSSCIICPKKYEAELIREISGNKFICFSNYGFKIYSLNEKNEYSIFLLESHDEKDEYQKIILNELDKNNFIIIAEIKRCFGIVSCYKIIINKINLKEMTKTEKEKKLKEIGYGSEKLNESLKFTSVCQNIFEFGNGSFKGTVILKNKFLIYSNSLTLLIIDTFSGKILKIYKILIDLDDNLYKFGINIKKWNDKDDNKFFIYLNGNIILFELTNDIELKIINQSYFPGVNNLKILNKKNNRFYDDGKKETYYNESFFGRNNDKSCSISVY